MLKNITRALSFSLLIMTQVYANNSIKTDFIGAQSTLEFLEKYGVGFANLEHRNLGDLVRLHLPIQYISSTTPLLSLPNGIQLSYGELIMFGGDLFGNPTSTISSCEPNNRLACFKSQYDRLAALGKKEDKRCSNPHFQVKKLNNYFQQVETEIEILRQKGQPDSDYYTPHATDITKNLNKLTCGGSFISDLYPFGSYLQLAQVNYDHFVPDSMLAYKTGHRYALETAVLGYKKHQAGYVEEANRYLEQAYAQNVFANHYLTDSFSSGHMRTPGKPLETIFSYQLS